MSTPNDPWGRVGADGTVYVRTADGERVIGSWQAGDAAEALAFFKRKFEALVTEVDLLEQRIKTTDLSPGHAEAAIERLMEAAGGANAIGDLDGLRVRLEGLRGLVDYRREEVRAAREEARVQAKQIKERIVAEAERIAAEATHWKISGERMRQLLEEWKAAPRAERAGETALWKRLSTARNAFTNDADPQGEAGLRGGGPRLVHRLDHDRERVPRAHALMEVGGPGGAGRRGRALGAVQGRAGLVLPGAQRVAGPA